jgi:hypothetical protein
MLLHQISMEGVRNELSAISTRRSALNSVYATLTTAEITEVAGFGFRAAEGRGIGFSTATNGGESRRHFR